MVIASLGYHASRHVEIDLFDRIPLDYDDIQSVTVQSGSLAFTVGRPIRPRTPGAPLRVRE